jgi:hypothetical protein
MKDEGERRKEEARTAISFLFGYGSADPRYAGPSTPGKKKEALFPR